MTVETTFVEMRRLFDWFNTSPARAPLHILRVVERLGATAVPLLGREMCSQNRERRDVARSLFVAVAGNAASRGRAIQELQRIAASDAVDTCKVAALGLLAELGAPTTARFADPDAVQRISAAEFAEQLASPADIALAADMIVHQLAADAVLLLVTALCDVSPDRAALLAAELCGRHDVAPQLRAHIAATVPPRVVSPAAAERPTRPTRVATLERATDWHADGDKRRIVVATRKVVGCQRWRLWVVRISSDGALEDCSYDATSADADAAQTIADLIEQGYAVIDRRFEVAQHLIAQAARRPRSPNHCRHLPSAYFLGRDLLDLGQSHVAPTQSAWLGIGR